MHSPDSQGVDDRFTQWKRAFGRHYDALKQVRRVTDTQLAADIGVTRAAFANWRSRSIPKVSLVSRIALVLASRDPERASTIERDLLEAMQRGDAASANDHPLQRARAGQQISIGIVRYSSFSTFFAALTETLLRFAAIAPHPSKDVSLPDAIDGLKQLRFDIIAALFATPDRLAALRFITTPLRLHIAEITTHTVRHSAKPVLPIVAEGEVGHSYARFILHNPRPVFSAYDREEFAAGLLKELTRENVGICRPSIYVDELMAMEVMVTLFCELIDGIRTGKISDISSFKLFMPTISIGKRDIEPETKDSIKPSYYLGIGVYRPEVEWYDYLSESWSIFAKSNLDYITSLYVKLFFELRDKVDKAQGQLQEKLKDIEGPYRMELEREIARFLDHWDSAIIRWLRFDLAIDIAEQRERRFGGVDPDCNRAVRRLFEDPSRKAWRDAAFRNPVIEDAESAAEPVGLLSPDLNWVTKEARLGALEYPWSAIVTMAAEEVADKLSRRAADE